MVVFIGSVVCVLKFLSLFIIDHIKYCIFSFSLSLSHLHTYTFRLRFQWLLIHFNISAINLLAGPFWSFSNDNLIYCAVKILKCSLISYQTTDTQWYCVIVVMVINETSKMRDRPAKIAMCSSRLLCQVKTVFVFLLYLQVVEWAFFPSLWEKIVKDCFHCSDWSCFMDSG